MYGKIEYNSEGLPKCEICGEYFKRVVPHVRMKHDGMTHREYKKRFGFDIKKGICSKESSELSRFKNSLHFHKVVQENLMQKGANTRFTKGHVGRPKEKISAATMMRLKQQSFIKKQLE